MATRRKGGAGAGVEDAGSGGVVAGAQTPSPSRTRRVAIVTGGNRGIGRATVEMLLEHGVESPSPSPGGSEGGEWMVVVACRTLSHGESVARDLCKRFGEGRCVAMRLDLCDLASVRAFVGEFLARDLRLDALVNNAGVLRAGPDAWREVTGDGLEEHFQANYLGHFVLTQGLLPLLLGTAREAGDAGPRPRVVNVSSHLARYGTVDYARLGHALGRFGFEAYTESKYAQYLATRELHRRHGPAGLYVYCVDPGEVNTDITRNFPGYALIKPLLQPFQKTARDGAATAVKLLTMGDAEARALAGKFLHERCQVLNMDATHNTWITRVVLASVVRSPVRGPEDEECARLWKVSEALAARPPGRQVQVEARKVHALRKAGQVSPFVLYSTVLAFLILLLVAASRVLAAWRQVQVQP